MADYIIHGETLTDIADAIREKTETVDPILTENMATMISNIETGGADLLLLESQSTFNLNSDTCPTESTIIPNRMFNSNERIREVNMPGIKTIEDYAFYACKATSLYFPDAETIGYQSFYQCRGSGGIPLDIPKAKTIGADAFRGAYITTGTKYAVCQGKFNESASAGSTYASMCSSNNMRGRFVDLYPVTDGMKIKWNNTDYRIIVAYFDSDKLFRGVNSGWLSSGEVTINISDGPYIAICFQKDTSSYYIYPSNFDHIAIKIYSGDTLIADFTSHLDLSECISIGDNAFRDAYGCNFYLPKCESLGTCWGWSCCQNYSLILPSIKTMGNQPFRGVSFTNLVLGPNWVSCGSDFAGYDADWSGRYIYSYAINPPTMSNSFSIRNNPVAFYVPEDSVDAYKAANYWSQFASIIQAMPSDHLTIDTWL